MWRRTAVTAALSGMLWSCGGDSLRVQTPPPAPLPRAAEPELEQPPAPPQAEPETAEIAAAPTTAPASDAPLPVEPDPPPVAESRPEPELSLADQRIAALSPEERAMALHVRELQMAALATPSSYDYLADEPALEPEEGSVLDEITEEIAEEGDSIDEDLSDNREQRLLATQSDLPLTLNDRVARMINYFTTGSGRGTFRITWGRASAYREMIGRVFAEEGVPLELIHLAQAESGFRPKVKSYAAATGMWQFMAFRGKQYGLRQDRYLEERYDPEKAARAAAKHLNDLYIEFGDWYLALAAYNCGPRRVERAIERGGTRDYWELSEKMLLPRQTRDYVPIILAMTYIAKNLDLYDMGVIDYAPARKYDSVETDSEVSLQLAADIAGTSVTELEELNPALLRSATPPYEYQLRLPEGAADDFAEQLALIPRDKRLDWRQHEVGDGDSLEAIAAKWKVDRQQLIAANGLDPADLALEAGMALNIPTTTAIRSYRSDGGGGYVEGGSGRYRIARGDTLGGIARRFGVSVTQLRQWNGLSSTRIRAGRFLKVNPAGLSASNGLAPDGRYRIQTGDTLGALASRFGASVSQLMAWNGLTSTRIHVGDYIRVPSLAKFEPAPDAPASFVDYEVRRGDTLAGIAGRHDVSIADLQTWNDLPSTQIDVGQTLKIQGSTAAASTGAAAPRNPRHYQIQPGDSLASIARDSGVSVADLQAWNGLSSSVIRAGESLIVGEASTSAAAGAAGRHRIQPGDTLVGIANQYGVSVSDLRQWNGLRTSRIAAGTYLEIRGASDTPAAVELASAGSPNLSPAPDAGPYKVRSGDTLGGIAERYGVSAADLRSWNDLRSSRIWPGQVLKVAPPRAAAGQYRIQPGDTLELIAQRFNVTVDQLKAWNGLRGSQIRAGDYLNVGSSSTASLRGAS